MDVFCIDSVDIDSIECIRDPCVVSTVLTYKKVMGRNVWMCFDSSINSLDKHSIQCIACFDLCIDSVDKQDTILNAQ